MQELVELWDTQPNVKKLNMEFRNIRDLTPLVTFLSKFRHLAEISFHGNKITSLPALDSLRALKAIDLTNNPIKIDHFLLDRLHQSPHLEQLYIDCSREQRETIAENMPHLRKLNGELIVRELNERKTLEEQLRRLEGRLGDEMRKIRQTYIRLAGSLEASDSEGEGRPQKVVRQEELSLIYKDIQEEMAYFSSGLADRLSREGVFAYCRNKLTVVLDNLMVRVLDETASEVVVRMYEEVCRVKAENFDALLKIILNASYEAHLNDQLEKPTNRLRKETLYQNEIFRLKKEVAELRQEQAKFTQINEKQQNLLERKTKPLNKSSSNARPLNKSPSNFRQTDRTPSPNRLPSRSPSAHTLSQANARTPPKTPLSRIPSVRVVKAGKAEAVKTETVAPVMARGGKGKTLSMEQLTKLIEEILGEKRRFNQRSLSKNEPFETSEEFLFTFFSRKYGLKEVALEWSLAVIKAVQLYCKESIEVEIFGKILKNQLYEEYYDEFKEFSKQIDKAFRQARLDKPAATLSESVFKRLFFYFFSFEEEEAFSRIAQSFTFPVAAPQFAYFLQSYKLAFEQKHLAPFLKLFYSADSDDDSAVTAAQAKFVLQGVIALHKDLAPDEATSKLQQYSAIIDTFRKNKFIFSELFQLAHPLL